VRLVAGLNTLGFAQQEAEQGHLVTAVMVVAPCHLTLTLLEDLGLVLHMIYKYDFPFVFPHVNNQASKSRKSAKIEL